MKLEGRNNQYEKEEQRRKSWREGERERVK
jgi:hypothetical protein